MPTCGIVRKIENGLTGKVNLETGNFFYFSFGIRGSYSIGILVQHFWNAFQIDASNAASAEIPTAAHPPPWTIPASPMKAWGLVDGDVELGVAELLLLLSLLLVLLMFELLSSFSMAPSIPISTVPPHGAAGGITQPLR